MHTIAAKAVCLKEAMQPEFREYQKQVVANAKALAAGIAQRGFRIVSGGTDNHLFLVDLYSRGLTGKDAQAALDRAGITVNKNSIPFDPTPPMTARRHSPGQPGGHHARNARAGDGAHRRLDRRSARRIWATPPPSSACAPKWPSSPRSFRSTRGAGEQRAARRSPGSRARALSANTPMRVAIDIRRAGDYGLGTYIRNIVNQLARIDDDTHYLLIGQQRHLAEFDPLPAKFRAARIPARARHLSHAPAPALAAAPAPRGRAAHALVLRAGHGARAPGDHGARPDRRADAAGGARRAPVQTGRLFFARRALERADHILAVSQSSKRELARTFGVPEAKISVVYNAVDERFLGEPLPADADRILERHAVNSPYVLYAGNIKPQKNLAAPDRSLCGGQGGTARSSGILATEAAGDRRSADAAFRSAPRRGARARARRRALSGIRAAAGAARLLCARARVSVSFALRRLRPAAARSHGPRHAGAHLQCVVAAGSFQRGRAAGESRKCLRYRARHPADPHRRTSCAKR